MQSAPKPVVRDSIDQKALLAVKKRFMQINHARLRRTISTLNPHQEVFFESLPMLLHVNHPLLPGYVSDSTPSGISCYEPSRQQVRAVKSIARTFQYEELDAKAPRLIENISMMGSCGTIAHSRSSDMDFWVCHDPNLLSGQLSELEKKLDLIQQWAEGLGLEVYFFLMDASRFRQGLRRGVSGEDCGTAQHYLLLDEFYRTSILIEGRYPVWWLVPSELEASYDEFVEQLRTGKHIAPDECIDFGGIARIPAGEFIGAGMWQLYKGIDSPYKSVIKIMLTELYASEHPNVQPLSVSFKHAIYSGRLELNQLDPYVMLYRRLAEYFKKQKADGRLELLRRCLYLKINEPMSRPEGRGTLKWRREAMGELVEEWGWDSVQYKTLDGRTNWKVHQVKNERKRLVDELNFSYRFLSRFARENRSALLIDEQDMNLLGRKLYAAFERKSGKVELINPNIVPSLTEEYLTLIREEADPHSQKPSTWVIYGGRVKLEEQDIHEPIKRGRSVVELMVWCYFNGIVDVTTNFVLFPGFSKLTEPEIKRIVSALQGVYPNMVGPAEQQQYHSAASPKQLILFVNIGKDPMSDLNRKGVQRLTDRTDPFNYSGLRKNLVLSIDQVLVNSWHEITTSFYSYDNVMIDCLLDFLRQVQRLDLTGMCDVQVFCFSSDRATSIAERVEAVFNQVVQRFCLTPDAYPCRYVLEMDQGFYVLDNEKKKPNAVYCRSKLELLKYLGRVQSNPDFVELIFDSQALSSDLLPELARFNRPNSVQVFYQKLNMEDVGIHIFDEFGSCFYWQEHHIEEQAYFSRLVQFIQRAHSRENLSIGESENVFVPKIQCFELFKSRKLTIERREFKSNALEINYHPVQVLVKQKDPQSHHYTFYCDHLEFSEFEHGDDIFKVVAGYIHQQRLNGEKYPIHITDLDLSGLQDDSRHHSTSFFLQQKFALEGLLNRALQLL